MEFEFDPKKSENNKQKHGIDFYKAQELWDDSDLIEIPLKTSDEPRFLVIGRISEKHWSGIIAYRSDKRLLQKSRMSLICHAEFISASNEFNGLRDPETSSG